LSYSSAAFKLTMTILIIQKPTTSLDIFNLLYFTVTGGAHAEVRTTTTVHYDNNGQIHITKEPLPNKNKTVEQV